MKIAFAVNRVETEQDNYTTIRLARKASALGHEVALIGLGDFIYDAEGSICAMATVGQQKKFKSDKTYLAHLHDAENTKQRICIGDYDILMLRSTANVCLLIHRHHHSYIYGHEFHHSP